MEDTAKSKPTKDEKRASVCMCVLTAIAGFSTILEYTKGHHKIEE